MNKKIGFIGCGNMARAMIAGLLDSNIAAPDSILASNSTSGKLEAARKDFGIGITSDNKAVARFADILILSVKPNKYAGVIREIRNDVKKEAVIVTIAAGIKIRTIEAYFGKELKIVRAMPNIPAVVGEAMTALCCNGQVTEEELKSIYDIFSSFGLAETLDEELLDVVTGKHPGQLKDSVCSAGGTAIEAVYSLEKKGFRGHVIEAIQRCTEKAERLGIEINGKSE